MTILYPTPAPVKTTTSNFGRGNFARRQPFTSADLAWLIQDNARREQEARDLDRLVDQMAEEAAWQDRYERGLC